MSLFVSAKHKHCIPSELRPNLNACPRNSAENVIGFGSGYSAAHNPNYRLGSSLPTEIVGAFSNAQTRQVYEFTTTATGKINASNLRKKIFESVLKLFADVSSTTEHATHQLATVSLDNVTSNRDVDVDVDITQNTASELASTFDLNMSANNVSNIVEKTVDSFLQIFKNTNVDTSTFSNTTNTERNLLTSLISIFQSEPQPSTVAALLEKSNEAKTDFTTERTKILANKSITSMTTNLKTALTSLARQAVKLSVSNVVSETSVKVRLTVRQFSTNIMNMLIKCNFMQAIMTAIDETDTFSISQDLSNALSTTNTHESTRIQKDETLSSILLYGAIVVGVIALLILIIKVF